MFIVQFTNAATFATGEGFVGPFSAEHIARNWVAKNTEDGAEYRIIRMCDIWEASL